MAYYSGTGNTEKVAHAIREEIMEHDVDLLPVNGVDPTSLGSYELVFLGSGLYGFNVSRKLTSLIKKAPCLPKKFAYFYTHENPFPNAYPDCFKSIDKILGKSDYQLLGTFDCCGENLAENAEKQRKAFLSRLSPEEKKKAQETFLELVKGHPDANDLENVKKFAKSILNKL
ncbi:MAG: flavodoxin family protein [Candidatus Thorarchaeota archaeon]